MTGMDQSQYQYLVRATLARHLRGNGLELGPGHSPLKVPAPGVNVTYVDRWEPDENRELFPELGDAAPFAKPDIISNLDVDRLSVIADDSQDFLIASHVLEHLANPLAQLAEIQRVLRIDGVALILLPDRRFTFDRERSPTPLSHLVNEYRLDVQTVDDAHVEDFCRGTGERVDDWSKEERHKQFAWHRQRSIHVHCWSQEEFLPVVEHAVQELGMRWELVDAVFVEDVPGGCEFGLVLRKASLGDPVIDTARVRTNWEVLRRASEGSAARAVEAERRAEELARAIDDLNRERQRADSVEAVLHNLRSNPAFPVARAGYRAVQRLRAVIRRYKTRS